MSNCIKSNRGSNRKRAATAPMCKSLTLLCLSIPLVAQQATFEGTASDAVTHDPLPGVHVRLFIQRLGAPSVAYGAISDENGHFSIQTIAPATYSLVAEHAGYAYLGPSKVALNPARNLTDFELVMNPLATISGRVLDRNGDPVQRASIGIIPANSVNPWRAIPRANATNEKGEFRAVGAPGKYYVEASLPPAGLNVSSAEILTPGQSPPFYVDTWFPGAASKDGATAVEVGPGQEVQAIDIRLASQRPLKISGVLKGLPEGTLHATLVAQGPGNRPHVVTTGPGGKFLLDGLTPGTYRFSVLETNGLSIRRVEVNLDSSDVTDIELTLQAPEKLTGKLEAPGDVTKMSVVLEPSGDLVFSQTRRGVSVPDTHGAFTIEGVVPARYRVMVNSLPGNSYVNEVRLDGVLTDGTVDLSNGVHGSKLTVIVSADGAEVSGKVEPSGEEASVYLAPDPAEIRAGDKSEVTPGGAYFVRSIRPGKYRIFAVDESSYARPNDLRAIAARAPEIELKPGDKLSRDLTLVDPDAR